MILLFTLSMPNRGSWNGGWSGERRNYTVSRNFGRSNKAVEKAKRILSRNSYYYRWDDGWGASIAVKSVTPSELRTAKRLSDGFCGYDWMVDSIIDHGEIYANHEIPEKENA